ncbi:hypothetical protein YC2023_000188 [Brassica napus]
MTTTASTAAIEVQGDPHADNPRSFVSTTPASKRAVDFSDVLIGSAAASAAAGCYGFPGGGNNIAQGSSSGTRVSSSSLGASGNETDEYDCESEEGVEAVVDDELPSKSRNSSKRCRAAEVHNLSEKRRRSRINEKMKALQSLIPNSNKTDKASMLDEAIEYLKQLQLQVQIRPPETTGDPLLNHSNQYASTSNAPEMINMPSAYTMEPSIRSHFGPFPHFSPHVEMSREGGLTHQRLNTSHPNANLTGEHAAFDGQHPEIKDRLT